MIQKTVVTPHHAYTTTDLDAEMKCLVVNTVLKPHHYTTSYRSKISPHNIIVVIFSPMCGLMYIA